MCGDFDNHEHIDDELFTRFVTFARELHVEVDPQASDTPTELHSESVRADYMDGIFKAGLTRCLNDAASLPSGDRMDAVAGQAIVFARLAGVLSAQLPPDSDVFRTVTNAFIDGNNEAASQI